jgi:preprotein translocase subunit SecF
MAQEVIRLHGGELTVQSQLGVGTTFTVLLLAIAIRFELSGATATMSALIGAVIAAQLMPVSIDV